MGIQWSLVVPLTKGQFWRTCLLLLFLLLMIMFTVTQWHHSNWLKCDILIIVDIKGLPRSIQEWQSIHLLFKYSWMKVLLGGNTVGLTHCGRVSPSCIKNLSWHWFRLWLVAWSAPSHYLTQCWIIVNLTPRKKAFENVIYSMLVILFRPQN